MLMLIMPSSTFSLRLSRMASRSASSQPPSVADGSNSMPPGSSVGAPQLRRSSRMMTASTTTIAAPMPIFLYVSDFFALLFFNFQTSESFVSECCGGALRRYHQVPEV